MVQRFFAHVRGNAVAWAALFVALGGTAFAAASVVPANSVGTAQLKNGAVTGQKVAHNTLTGANINASTLGTVPNANKLGGQPPTNYQRRVANGCNTGAAIRTVSPTGAITCQLVGQGTITGVTAGTGLTGGASSGPATLSVDPTAVQSRVSGSCTAGSAVASVDQSGSVTCQSTGAPVMGGSGTTTSGGNQYLAPEGVSTWEDNISDAQIISPAVPLTASNLSVSLGTAPTGGGYGLVLFVNGVSTNLTCWIFDPNTTCTDTFDSVSIPAGSQVAMYLQGISGSPPATTVSFSWMATS
jgi:hypothetical protein